MISSIPHIVRIVRYADNTKAAHYSGKVFIDSLTLFAGESREVTYTSTVKGGNEAVPFTNGSGATEIGHTGYGYARLTNLGNGILHEVYEPALPDEDDDAEESVE
jgi:hypothetical protein